jgi:sec-independent protein translocase protein TatA
MGRLHPEFIYSRVIAPNAISQLATGRRRRSQRLPGIKRADGRSTSRPRLAGRILGEEPMSKFVRAFSLRIDGFLVVVGGFLIFASMKAKVAKTESLPPPLPRRVALSHLT